MRKHALLAVILTACGVGMAAEAAAQSTQAPTLTGCWDLNPVNYRTPMIGTPTRIRLDSIPADYAPIHTYKQVERLTRAPAGVPQERAYWYMTPDHHLMIRLGDDNKSLTIDVYPASGNPMFGRLGDGGAAVRVTRIDCPKQ